MSDKIFYGPVLEHNELLGPYRHVHIPVASGGPGETVVCNGITVAGPTDLPDGAVGWIAYEIKRQPVARYEKAILEPEWDVFQ